MVYKKEYLEAFLKNQSQLFDEPVAETLEEADAFLDDCMAVVADSFKDVKDYFEENGMDTTGLTKEELLEESEVFALPDGKYLIYRGLGSEICPVLLPGDTGEYCDLGGRVTAVFGSVDPRRIHTGLVSKQRCTSWYCADPEYLWQRRNGPADDSCERTALQCDGGDRPVPVSAG